MTPGDSPESGRPIGTESGSAPTRLPATEQVLAGYCHDLNGQLASAMGFVYLLGPRIDAEGPGQHLRDCLERIEMLLRELRSMVRDDERTTTPSSLADLFDLWSTVVRQHPRFTRSSIEIRRPDDLPAVRVDPASGLRLLLLAVDAAVGGDAPPTIEVDVEVGAHTATVRFGPTGVGRRGSTTPLATEATEAGANVGADPDTGAPWLELPRLH